MRVDTTYGMTSRRRQSPVSICCGRPGRTHVRGADWIIRTGAPLGSGHDDPPSIDHPGAATMSSMELWGRHPMRRRGSGRFK